MEAKTKPEQPKRHRIEAYYRNEHAYCLKCERPLQQTGKGSGWTHSS